MKEASFEELVSSERVEALEALHNYVVAACRYDLPRSQSIFNRVVRTLDSLLSASERRRPLP